RLVSLAAAAAACTRRWTRARTRRAQKRNEDNEDIGQVQSAQWEAGDGRPREPGALPVRNGAEVGFGAAAGVIRSADQQRTVRRSIMVARSRRWPTLGLSAVLLVVGTHFVWPRRGGGGGGGSPLATVTYAWLKRQGPHGPNVIVDLYAPPGS